MDDAAYFWSNNNIFEFQSFEHAINISLTEQATKILFSAYIFI